MSVNDLRKTRETRAARTIAASLRPAEDTIDSSIAASAKLLGAIAQARLDAATAAEIGHDAFMRAAAGITALAAARDEIVNCHRQLAVTRDMRGLDESQVGCTVGKNPQASSLKPLVAAA